jgi:hypothetical protein
LNQTRLSAAAGGVGLAQACLDVATQYCNERKQFGQPIAQFQLVQQRLARMWVALSNCLRIVYGDWLAGRSLRESVADVCAGKLYCAEMGAFVALSDPHPGGGVEEYGRAAGADISSSSRRRHRTGSDLRSRRNCWREDYHARDLAPCWSDGSAKRTPEQLDNRRARHTRRRSQKRKPKRRRKTARLRAALKHKARKKQERKSGHKRVKGGA